MASKVFQAWIAKEEAVLDGSRQRWSDHFERDLKSLFAAWSRLSSAGLGDQSSRGRVCQDVAADRNRNCVLL